MIWRGEYKIKAAVFEEDILLQHCFMKEELKENILKI
jgi:hypothetical protein